MEFMSIVEIWKYLRWLPNFILKRLFTKERLADLVLVDVQPRHESVRANVGDIGSFEIYFQVINMSPFDVELDRAEIKFLCAGIDLKSHYIKKMVFKAGQVGSLYVRDDIETAKSIQISRLHDKNRSSISLHAEFNCKLHSFTKVCQSLEGVNVHFSNVDWRLSTLKSA